jgi:hypothetical protein
MPTLKPVRVDRHGLFLRMLVTILVDPFAQKLGIDAMLIRQPCH